MVGVVQILGEELLEPIFFLLLLLCASSIALVGFFLTLWDLCWSIIFLFIVYFVGSAAEVKGNGFRI